MDDFKKTNKAMKKELTLRKMNTLVMDWEKTRLNCWSVTSFLQTTAADFCRRVKKNIERFRKKVSKRDIVNASGSILPDVNPQDELDIKENALLTKGIQTMLRLTSENHLELSNMADGKASILISVNAIIISVILSVLIRRIEVDTHLTIPTILFLTSSLATIIVAILATRPKVSQGSFTREEILNKR